MTDPEGSDGRRPRKRRFWFVLVVVVLVALALWFGLRALGCGSQPLHVTITIRNTGAVALRSLSIDQVDGPGHVLVPGVAPGSSVTVTLTVDDHFGVSHLDLVDDATGRNYALPPRQFDGSLHGAIDVQVGRAGPGAKLEGRARSHTDSGADPQGWEPLRED